MSRPNSALRIFLLVLTAAQMMFIVFLTVFIIRNMDPRGGGMEFVAVSAAIMLLEIPFTIPAFILAVRGKAPVSPPVSPALRASPM
jgi:hypothetical protein